MVPNVDSSATGQPEPGNQPMGQIKFIGNNGTTKSYVKMKGFRKTKQIWGWGEILDEEDFSHVLGGNPQNQWFWHFFVQPTDAVTAPNVDVFYHITYYCCFRQRRLTTIS